MVPVLPALTCLEPALLLAGCVALIPRFRNLTPVMTLATCGAGLLLVLAGLAQPPQTLHLPLGLPRGTDLALDGVSGFMLLPVLVAGSAAAAAAMRAPARSGLLPLLVAAMMLAVLAADSFALLLALELAAMLCWGVSCAGRPDGARALGLALLVGACLLPALGLMVPGDGSLAFAALRRTVTADPPGSWREAMILLLAAPAAIAQIGLAPACLPFAPAPATALLAGAVPQLGFYLLLRVMFDACGVVPPGWGVPLLTIGALAMLAGAWRATQQDRLAGVLAAITVQQSGLVLLGLGLALVARGADLPVIGGLALGGALLQALVQSALLALLALGGGLIRQQTGTDELDGLGGLARRMPVTALCLMLAGGGLAAWPALPGFAGLWLLFHAALDASRIGALPAQTGIALLVAATALSVALMLAAMIRLIGVACLGPPRGAGAARAGEAGFADSLPMLLFAGLVLLLGALPGAALSLTHPARRTLIGPMTPVGDWWRLGTRAGAGMSYDAPALILLLTLVLAALIWIVRTRMTAGLRHAAPWRDGFPAQDTPETQDTGDRVSARALARPLRPAPWLR